MRHVFRCNPSTFFTVPDGTRLTALLSPHDATSGVPVDTPTETSVAAGHILPGVASHIHVMPHTTQLTVLVSGSLRIHMKDAGTRDGRYTLELTATASDDPDGFEVAAAVTRPGTLFQLDNREGTEAAHVLYVASPGYVFLPGDDDAPPIYDDSVLIGADWAELARREWSTPETEHPSTSAAARDAAIRELARRARTRQARDSSSSQRP